MNWLKLIFGAPIELAAKAYEAHLRKKTRTEELDDAKHARRMENVREGRMAEVDWNIKSIENSGWKDEYLTIILSLPLILVFIPHITPYIMDGFAALETTPVWYRSGISLMIASAFGYQKYTQNKMMKAYTLPPQEQANDKEGEV